MSDDQARYYSVKEAAKMLGRSTYSIRRLISDGEIPATPWRGSVGILRKEFDALCAAKDEEAIRIAAARRQAKVATPTRPVGRPRVVKAQSDTPKRPVGRPRKNAAPPAEMRVSESDREHDHVK